MFQFYASGLVLDGHVFGAVGKRRRGNPRPGWFGHLVPMHGQRIRTDALHERAFDGRAAGGELPALQVFEVRHGLSIRRSCKLMASKSVTLSSILPWFVMCPVSLRPDAEGRWRGLKPQARAVSGSLPGTFRFPRA